jgi:hypothetical protein
MFAGLRFPLHPAVVDILRYFDIYLHQLTPNAILRLSVYMWICRTTKIKPSSAPPAPDSLRRRRSICREGLPIWLFEFLLQVRRGEPRDRLSQQVAFGLATTLALPHCDSTRPREISPTVYEGAAFPS